MLYPGKVGTLLIAQRAAGGGGGCLASLAWATERAVLEIEGRMGSMSAGSLLGTGTPSAGPLGLPGV